jgi:hypothetical protein
MECAVCVERPQATTTTSSVVTPDARNAQALDTWET